MNRLRQRERESVFESSFIEVYRSRVSGRRAANAFRGRLKQIAVSRAYPLTSRTLIGQWGSQGNFHYIVGGVAESWRNTVIHPRNTRGCAVSGKQTLSRSVPIDSSFKQISTFFPDSSSSPISFYRLFISGGCKSRRIIEQLQVRRMDANVNVRWSGI